MGSKTIEKHGPMLSYYSFLYIIYFDIEGRVSIDQYCILQKLISGFQISFEYLGILGNLLFPK